jgi:hypothetical protein
MKNDVIAITCCQLMRGREEMERQRMRGYMAAKLPKID